MRSKKSELALSEQRCHSGVQSVCALFQLEDQPDLQVVVQVLAHAWQVMLHSHPVCFELGLKRCHAKATFWAQLPVCYFGKSRKRTNVILHKGTT
jgi:hypothetical protein